MSATKFPPEGIASRAWSEALSEHGDRPHDANELGRLLVCNAVLHAFNPPDDDVGYESIISDAIERAAMWIESQPCTCPPDPIEDGPCGRCDVLGRAADEVVSR